MDLSEIEWKALNTVADLYEIPEGAYNFRVNGKAVGRNSSANIDVDSREDGKGLKITISEDDSLTVDCNVNVAYGHSVVTVAKAVQDSITNAVESMAGVTVSAVNVNVCGIVRL